MNNQIFLAWKESDKVLFRKLRYKQYQKRFCKQFIKRSKEVKGYEFFLRHCTKHDFLRTSFCNIAIYDVLDNDGFNRLVRSIYKLKGSRAFAVNTHYIKHSFKKVDYINSNLSGTQVGSVAEVVFKKDKWIKRIDIYYTYVNASEVIVEYCFSFAKIIETYQQIHQFVIDSLPKVKKKYYFHSYADKKIVKTADNRELMKLDNIFFADILQGYICTLFYTKYGKEYKLPIEYAEKMKKYNREKAKKLNNVFLTECYQKGKEHLLVSNLNYDRFEVTRLVPGKYLPRPFLLSAFTDFPSESYYKAFSIIESNELEKHMRKYLNSRKSFISSKDIKWLVNKIRYIREKEDKITFELNEGKCIKNHGCLGWTCYVNGKKTSEDFINYPTFTSKYRKLYEQNLEYLNAIASVQNNKIIIILTVIGILATILGILISLLRV